MLKFLLYNTHSNCNIYILGIVVSEPVIFFLGDEVAISCSSDLGISSVEWIKDGQVQLSTLG